MDKKFLKDFASPPSPYRGKPFWAWNGLMDPKELRRQVRLFHRMGFGGFFMHARVGLATEYLGKEWFDCIRACADEAGKMGMEAWLYDEDRWPSGPAGGLVTKNARYRMRWLKMLVLDDPRRLRWDSSVVAAFTAILDGTTARDVRRIVRGKRPGALERGRKTLVFTVCVSPLSPAHNGYTYLDTLSREAVGRFIQVTHEAYRKNIGEFFGDTVPGIFTDEPMYGRDPDILPWTGKLAETFHRRFGYDVRDRLVEIHLDVPGREGKQARWHYWECVTQMFVDNFSGQIGQWCDKNGIQSTGHVLCEELLRWQTLGVGSCMRHYERMQAPGMDILGESRREHTTAKQVSSAARQFGRKWRLSEMYAATSWDFNFEGHKALGDWQAAMGINLRCHHLSFYTMLGEAKRDYPASIFYQSPWWEHYRHVEDYFARVGVAMTRGAEVRDLLVIHPIESMWLMRRLDWMNNPAVRDCDRVLEEINLSLQTEQIDFDYGDEDIIRRHAGVVSSRGGGATFKVAKASYKAVLVPQLKTIRSSTLALLEKFRAAGGVVVFAGEASPMVDALPSTTAVKFAARCVRVPATGKAMADAVAPTCRRVSVLAPNGQSIKSALYLLREDKEAFYLFVCNTGYTPASWDIYDQPTIRERRDGFPDVRILGFAQCRGTPLELDPVTGRQYAANARMTAGGWEIRTSLPRIASRLFVIPKDVRVRGMGVPPMRSTHATSPLNRVGWDFQLSEANVLPLDRPRFRIGQGGWQSRTEILHVDIAVRDALKLPHRGGDMVQPWARPKAVNPRSVPVTLSYNFDVRAMPSGDLFLAVEQPRTFRAAINGQALDTDLDEGWWVDKSLRRIRVDPALLRPGQNEITLEVNYNTEYSGLEIIYLLGQFGVSVSGQDVAVTALPKRLDLGDWVGQGLAFYSGNVTYRTKVSPPARPGQRLFVRMGEYGGVAVRVMVDGRQAGIVAWEPNELDITDMLGQGESELGLEVIGHRRNSHGPHHHHRKITGWTGPESYLETGERWFDGYQLVPCGLLTPPELVVKE